MQYKDNASRCMFIARLENMQKNGVISIKISDVFALINDCDMLAEIERSYQNSPILQGSKTDPL
jgi:hypothetical protein